MPGFAFERVRRNEAMPGVLVVDDRTTTGRALEDLILILQCSQPDEWEGRVTYLPL